MRLFKVALGLGLLTILQIIALARTIIQKLTGNSSFPTPSPDLITLSSATDTTTGSYYVDVTDTNGCSGTSNTASFTVGMTSLQNEKSVTIFPNPFSKLVNITLSNALQLTNVQFTLCDIYGRRVMNEKMEKNDLVIERGNLSEGIYFYSIFNHNGIIAAGKILIVE